MPLPGAQAVPPASPAQAQPAEGLQMRARVQVVLARKLLEQAVPVLGAGSDEGKKILKALSQLSDIYQGAPAGGIQQAEMKSLAAQAPAGPQPTPPQGGGQMGGAPMGGPVPGAMV